MYIYNVEGYVGERKKQAHFSRENKKTLTGFYFGNCQYSRYISSFFFEIDNYTGYDMYLPCLFMSDPMTSSTFNVGEWNWNKKEKKWIFYRKPRAYERIYPNWENPDLNTIISEGTNILNNGNFIPDKERW